MEFTDTDDANGETVTETAMEQTTETQKNSRLALYIAFLALFFTVIGITVGYKHWLRIHEKAKLALKEISTIHQQLDQTASKSSVNELRKHFEESSNAAEQRLAASIQELDQIREKTAYSAQTVTDQIAELTLRQKTGTTALSKQPMMAEIRFLLESANRRLTLSYDKDSALALLKEADQLFIRLDSPEWLSVRDKLAQDIAKLKQFSLPDVLALSSLIDTLENKIIPLAQIEKELPNGKQIQLFENPQEDTIPGKIKTYLNKSITIKKQTDPPRYALDKSNKERVDLLLKLRLESLRLMLMQRNNASYHQQIAKLKHMLETYYASSVAKPWVATLDRLDAKNLTPALPTITTALEEFVSMQTNKADTKATPQANTNTDTQ